MSPPPTPGPAACSAPARFRALRALSLWTSLLLGGAAPLEAQEVGAFMLHVHSEHPELSQPQGFGGFASVPISDWVRLRLAYDRISQSFRGEGQVCAHYGPNLGCRVENVESNTSLGSFSLTVLPTLSLADMVRAGLGGGMSFSSVAASSIGESGREANYESPKTGQYGYVALFTLGIQPLRHLPFTLIGAAAGHWVKFKQCVSYEEVYAPFCGTTLFKELSVGLALNF